MHIRFASDRSVEAQQLRKDLQAVGHVVEEVSGSHNPIATSGALYGAGHVGIRTRFVDPFLSGSILRLAKATEIRIGDTILRRCSVLGVVEQIEWPHDTPGAVVFAVAFEGDRYSRDWYHPEHFVAVIQER